MESERDTPSSAAPYVGWERGAGGKLRKPFTRKPPSTPYDRPPVKQSTEPQDSGWLSKLVTPARRLIASGATMILPSFFSKSASSVDDQSPSNAGDHCESYVLEEKQEIEVTQNACTDDNDALKLGISGSVGAAVPSNVVDGMMVNPKIDGLERDNLKSLHDESELAKIEHLVKGKRFSRDEINRLTEILNSRVVDISDAKQGNKTSSSISQGQTKRDSLVHQNPLIPIERKQENMGKAILETPTPRFQSKVGDEVTASPVDIARAYMGSRTSEIGLDSYGFISKDERAGRQSDAFPSKPFIPTPSPKSSTCWPGAMVQDQRNLTPQSQGGRYGFHNFPRTPYSRTLYSKPKSKLTQLQGDSRSRSTSSTPFQQSRTPSYGQLMPRSDVVDGGNGSVGPIRRVQNKFASGVSSRGSSFSYPVQNAPLLADKASSSREFLPVFGKNMEPGGTSGTSKDGAVNRVAHISEGVGISTASSSASVRKILEHLDRHRPTPKEKADELKLVTAWKESPSDDTSLMPKENTSLADSAGSDLHKTGVFAEVTGDRGNLKGKTQETSALDAMTKTSSIVTGDGRITADAFGGSSSGFKNACDSLTKSMNEAIASTNSGEKDTSQLWSPDPRANGKRPSQPILKPISLKRPDPRNLVSSDNGPGFTFPFSSTAGLATEPPTPSIMPSILAGAVNQQKEGPAVPEYSFGTRRSTSQLTFSFPSTSSASVNDDSSDIKFNFGSDKKRVSFASVGKDAICY